MAPKLLMKTKLSFLSLLLCSMIASAQPETQLGNTVSFGVKGGLNFANIGGDASGVEYKPDFHVGLFLIDKKSETFAIMPEIVFSRQGAQASASNKIKINYSYINIPLMLSYFPTEQVFLQAGPQLGILVEGKITDGTDTQNIKDQLNNIDFGLGFGIGGNFERSIISARYNLGIANTAKDSQDGGKYPNQVFQLSIGFKMN